ncbi:glycosyltransferase family 2 protein [Kiloniella laminariae]|uniref:Glycosyltransferase family 2 protein n=1 Tax=Kiloniella laminariae TaxID=454162 RepID=A0ABT4LMQ6_9PROT|nr:glycosyltransferase family 2 protein [Kiloniella laminariae]MCZ4282351.1 glycosyltransferase family 2 protein [Kiloniella laminariae]
MPKVAIIIPALNEANTIYDIVKGLTGIGLVIVVDDGSIDGTSTEALRGGATVIKHDKNRGYDKALAAGFVAAIERDAQILLTCDADGQHSLESVHSVLKAMSDDNTSIAIGARNYFPRFSEYLFGYYTKKRFSIPDPLCGLKAIKSDVYKKYNNPKTRKTINTGLLLDVARDGGKISSVPINIISRQDNQARIGGVLKANYRILRAWAKCIANDLRFYYL